MVKTLERQYSTGETLAAPEFWFFHLLHEYFWTSYLTSEPQFPPLQHGDLL